MPERKRKFFSLSPEARRNEARTWVGKDAIVTIGRVETAQSKFKGKACEVLHVTFVGDVLVLESEAKRFGVRLTDIAAINAGWGDQRDGVGGAPDRDTEAEARRTARAQAVGRATAERMRMSEAAMTALDREEPF